MPRIWPGVMNTRIQLSELRKIKPHLIWICDSETINDVVRVQPYQTTDGTLSRQHHDPWAYHADTALISSLFFTTYFQPSTEVTKVRTATVERMLCVDILKEHMCMYPCLTYMVRNEVYRWTHPYIISARWALTDLANKYCQSPSIQRLERKVKFDSSSFHLLPLHSLT